MREATPIAVAIADLHLSLTPPVCRAETDWLEVQARYLQQVKDIAKDLGVETILCAGDIFDRWNSPPELITFALRHLPDEMICVPGQHDLPNHRMDRMDRSAYGVLEEARKIRSIAGAQTGNLGGFIVHGFGWEQEITPAPSRSLMSVALIHCYCWMEGSGYPGAPEESRIGKFARSLQGYRVAIFGDNHSSFQKELKNGTTVLNVGGFIRRKFDERQYQPAVGIIHSDGHVERKRLDTSKDQFHDAPDALGETSVNMKDFIAGLEGLGEHGLDFREAVKNHLRSDDISPEVKEIIWRILETTK